MPHESYKAFGKIGGMGDGEPACAVTGDDDG